MSLSLENNCDIVTWVQLWQFHLGTILPVQFGKKSNLCLFDKGNGERYLRGFSLQNLNVLIYYIANKVNTFNDFLLPNMYGYLIIYLEFALISETVSSKRVWSLFQSLKYKGTSAWILIRVSLKCISICIFFLKFTVSSFNVQNKITCQIIPFFK